MRPITGLTLNRFEIGFLVEKIGEEAARDLLASLSEEHLARLKKMIRNKMSEIGAFFNDRQKTRRMKDRPWYCPNCTMRNKSNATNCYDCQHRRQGLEGVEQFDEKKRRRERSDQRRREREELHQRSEEQRRRDRERDEWIRRGGEGSSSGKRRRPN